MEWSRDKTVEFIAAYKIQSILWDCKHEFYKDRIKRHEALEVLAKQFGTQTTEVERKIKNLQSHFLRERKRIVLTKSTNTSTWFAYKPLSFLLARNTPEKRKNIARIIEPAYSPNDAKLRRCNQTAESSYENASILPDCSRSYQETVPESHSVVKEMFKWFKDRDEFDLYGEQIAIKLRNIASPYARVAVQNRMNTLLMEAELGLFDTENHYAPATMEFYPETKVDVSSVVTP